MRKRLLSALLVLTMVFSLALTGCGGGTQQTDTTKAADTTQKPADNTPKLDADQTVSILGYDFKSLDQVAESDAETFTVYNHVFEGLGREVADADGTHKVILAGASDMKVSSDGLVYTFTIRDGAVWSDGKPVSAKDYEFSWKRLINPDNAFDYQTFLSFVKNVPEYQDGKAKIEDVGIKALNDKTFQVTLSTPTPYFDKMLSFGCLTPQREDEFNKLGKDYGQAWEKRLYNGPFVISDYQKGSKIQFTKNEKYWDAKNVKITKIEAPIVQEIATLVQMFQAKQLDQTGASGDFIKQLDDQKAAGGFDHITGTTASTAYIMFSFKNPVFASSKVRQAMVAVFDKKTFLDTVYKRFIPAYGIVPTQILVGDKEYRKEVPEPVKPFIESVKDPKALFIEGLKEMNMNPDPSKVTLQLLLGPQTSTSSAYGQFVQNQYKTTLGINIELVFAVDSPTYFQSRTKGEFDLCGGGWGADYNDASSYFQIFTSTDGNNNGKYNNKEYDDLIAKAAKELDSAKRLEMYKKAEQILLVSDPGIINTYYQDLQTFRYKWLKNIMVPLFGGYYVLRDAYIQGRQ